MWETWIQLLGWENALEEGMATHSSILAWRIPMDRGAWRATVLGVTKSQTGLSNQAQHEPPSDTGQDCLGAFHTHLRRVIMTLNKVHKPWFVPTVLYSTHSHPTNGILPFLCKINFSLLFNSLPL